MPGLLEQKPSGSCLGVRPPLGAYPTGLCGGLRAVVRLRSGVFLAVVLFTDEEYHCCRSVLVPTCCTAFTEGLDDTELGRRVNVANGGFLSFWGAGNGEAPTFGK